MMLHTHFTVEMVFGGMCVGSFSTPVLDRPKWIIANRQENPTDSFVLYLAM